MVWADDRRTSNGLAGRVVVAVCSIAALFVGGANLNDSEETATDVVAIARDAGAQLEREDFSLAPTSLNVEVAVDDVSGTYNELDVASAGSAGESDLYQITAPDTQETACLAVSAGEPPPGEFLGSVDVSTSVTSGPC